jgi:hypothetical protein
MNLKKIFLGISILVCTFFIIPKPALAIAFDLIPPSGTLTRGSNIDFTINIDTEGSSVTSTEIGLTYDTSVLEFVSATKGEAMSSISSTNVGSGKILITGTNSSDYNGSGVFATITFKIIATQSGETELCTLWIPETSATPTPTTAPNAPTSTPRPVTVLPTSGSTGSTQTAGIVGALLLLGATGLYFLSSNSYPKKHHRHIRHQNH